MIICCCANANDEAVRQAARTYLNGVYTVTDKVIVEIRRGFGSMDSNCGGSCLNAIAKIVIEEAELMNINIHESVLSRKGLIQVFKDL
tara:strand:- start:211285 stop:211548 length:264 start_codon:yes stop_codon:yes gene_type:complete